MWRSGWKIYQKNTGNFDRRDSFLLILIPKNSNKFTGKHSWYGFFFEESYRLQTCNFTRKTQPKCFLVSLVSNIFGQLFLENSKCAKIYGEKSFFKPCKDKGLYGTMQFSGKDCFCSLIFECFIWFCCK